MYQQSDMFTFREILHSFYSLTKNICSNIFQSIFKICIYIKCVVVGHGRNDIWGFIDTGYFFFILVGIQPLSRIKKNGQYVYSINKHKNYNLPLMLYTILFIYIIQQVPSSSMCNKNFIEKTLCYSMNCVYYIIGASQMIILSNIRTVFMNGLTRVGYLDTHFQKLGMTMDYTLIMRLNKAAIVIGTAIIFIIVYIYHILLKKYLAVVILNGIFEVVSFTSITASTLTFLGLAANIHKKFQTLNNYIEMSLLNFCEEQIISKNFIIASNLQMKIYKLAEDLINSFGITIFSIIVLCYTTSALFLSTFFGLREYMREFYTVYSVSSGLLMIIHGRVGDILFEEVNSFSQICSFF